LKKVLPPAAKGGRRSPCLSQNLSQLIIERFCPASKFKPIMHIVEYDKTKDTLQFQITLQRGNRLQVSLWPNSAACGFPE
jgi:hypothetical protein